jgi:hypothetical protein
MLRRRQTGHAARGLGVAPKEKPAPKRGLKVLKEDVVGTYAAGAHNPGTVPAPPAQAVGSRFVKPLKSRTLGIWRRFAHP